MLKKQGTRPPSLLRGSLAYIFSEMLIWLQYINRVCEQNVSSYRNFLYTVWEIKGLGTFFRLILSEKKNRFSGQTIHHLSMSDVKMLLLTGKVEKASKVRDFFLFTRSTKFPPFVSNFESGAKPKLAHARAVPKRSDWLDLSMRIHVILSLSWTLSACISTPECSGTGLGIIMYLNSQHLHESRRA